MFIYNLYARAPAARSMALLRRGNEAGCEAALDAGLILPGRNERGLLRSTRHLLWHSWRALLMDRAATLVLRSLSVILL